MAQSCHIAAYYYPWYTPRHWKQGYTRGHSTPPQPPLLGEYKSKNRTVIHQHMEWSQAYGIDSWICSWWGQGKRVDRTLRERVLPCLTNSELSFALLYETAGILGMQAGKINIGEAAIEQLRSDVDYLATRYFSHPNYLHLEGKPVLFLYLTRALTGRAQTVIHTIREVAAQRGFGLYLVGDEVFWGPPDQGRIGLLDAITAYNMHGPAQYAGYPDESGILQAIGQQYRRYERTAQGLDVDFIPNVFPSFDDTGVRPQAQHYIIPDRVHPDSAQASTLSAYLEIARTHLGHPPHLLTVTSFNEWHEDTQVEPTMGGYGFQRLEAIRAFKAACSQRE